MAGADHQGKGAPGLRNHEAGRDHDLERERDQTQDAESGP